MKRKIIVAMLAFMMAAGLSAQVDVTVVSINGNLHRISLESSGEIYITASDMVVMTSSATGTTVSFSLDTVHKVLFSDNLGIANLHGATSLVLYPSPAAEQFYVSGISAEPQQLTVFNAAGTKVMETICREGEPVGIGRLPEGVYLVRVGSAFGKIVKQ